MDRMISTEELARLIEAATPGPFSCQTLEVTGYVYGPDGNLIAETFGAIGGAVRANTHLLAHTPDLAAEVIRLRAQVAAAEKLAEAARYFYEYGENDRAVFAALASWEASK